MIKLTFYSGKLWHNDKPFPVHIFSDSPHAVGSRLFQKAVERWLSTAYEVVNPGLVIMFIGEEKRAFKSLLPHPVELVNGDQVTLPDGYGISESDFYSDPKRRATITLPEKPENSAHGYTELLSKEQFNSPANQNRDNAIVGFIKTGLDKIDESGLQLTNHDKAQLLTRRIENQVVEPSESQEEKQFTELEVRILVNRCINEYARHLASNGCDVGPFDEFNSNEWLDQNLRK